LSKLLKIGQSNATKLDAVLENQEKFQAMLDSQQSQITTLMAKFASQPEETTKGKGKGKADNEFYHVSIYHFLCQFLMLFLHIIICITGDH
jgi:hypothetical protein